MGPPFETPEETHHLYFHQVNSRPKERRSSYLNFNKNTGALNETNLDTHQLYYSHRGPTSYINDHVMEGPREDDGTVTRSGDYASEVV